MEAHKTQPHSDQLERSVLSACVYFDADRAIVLEQLNGEDFYSPRNGELFGIVRAFARAGAPCDPVLLREACKSKPNALALLDELEVSLHPDIDAVCTRLRSLAAARRVTRAALTVAASGLEATTDPESFLDRANQQLLGALQSRESKALAVSLSDVCDTMLAEYAAPAVESKRVSTGIAELNRVLTGLEDGRLYVAAGRPGMGKSALAMQMAVAAAEQGARALIFSLEMPKEEIGERMACSVGGVDSKALQARTLDDLGWRRFVNATNRIAGLPVSMVESAGITIEQIARAARQERARNGLGIVVVDYLQLVRSGRRHDNREQEVSEISRELKILARELSVPVIAVSQLNRDVEKRANKRPMMSDLRESGAIEQDADVILLLYREDYYDDSAQPGVCEVIVGKNRGGSTGFVKVHFEAKYTRFTDLGRAV